MYKRIWLYIPEIVFNGLLNLNIIKSNNKTMFNKYKKT